MNKPKVTSIPGIREIFAVAKLGEELEKLHQQRADTAANLHTVETDLAIREAHVKEIYKEEYLKQKNEDARKMLLQARLNELSEYIDSSFKANTLRRQLIIVEGDIVGKEARLRAVEAAYKQMQLYALMMDAMDGMLGWDANGNPNPNMAELQKLNEEIWGPECSL